MNSLAVLESWIISKLLASTTITNAISGRIYLGEAPEQAGDSFVLYSYVDSRTFYTYATKRNLSESFYDIVGWKKGPDTASVKTLANEIDTLFSEVRAEVFQGYEFSSQTQREISFVDQSDKSETWRRLGGTYRIIANKL